MERVCVITGGAAGIGRCIVETFAEKGYKVYFIDKSTIEIRWLEDKMQARGYSVMGFEGDIPKKKR